MSDKTIYILVEDGCVYSVRGLPDDWTYIVDDRDDPDEEWAIVHAKSGELVEDGFSSEEAAYYGLKELCALEGWNVEDYAVEECEWEEDDES